MMGTPLRGEQILNALFAGAYFAFIFILVVLVFMLVRWLDGITGHPFQQLLRGARERTRELSAGAILYEKRTIICPWCHPPGSGERNVPGVASLGIIGGTSVCGDCAGAGSVRIKLHRFDAEKRKAVEKKWGIEERVEDG